MSIIIIFCEISFFHENATKLFDKLNKMENIEIDTFRSNECKPISISILTSTVQTHSVRFILFLNTICNKKEGMLTLLGNSYVLEPYVSGLYGHNWS